MAVTKYLTLEEADEHFHTPQGWHQLQKNRGLLWDRLEKRGGVWKLKVTVPTPKKKKPPVDLEAEVVIEGTPI